MSSSPVDPIRQESKLFGEQRRAVQRRCDDLHDDLRAIDAQLSELARRRRDIVVELRRHRDRLYPRILTRGRQPMADGAEQLPPVAADATFLSGRRLRSVCLALLRQYGTLALTELHVLLHRDGYAVAHRRPVQALADALGYEHDCGRAERVSRGTYAAASG